MAFPDERHGLDRSAQTSAGANGSRWEDLPHLLDTGTGLIPVGGGCLTVGLPGSCSAAVTASPRSYGLGSDNVLSIDLVTADGVRIICVRDAGPARTGTCSGRSRGGGGGNFGVAVAAELRVHRPGPRRC
jgi:FAD/FMN-containing dehydrogenase